MDDADVVIVGAGPAGATAAYHLARRGRRVILLDRSAFPRDKPCGDAVTRAGVRLLAEMGVLGDLGRTRPIGGLSVSLGPEGRRSTRDFDYGNDGYGIVVPRAVLDEAIVARAADAGADFRDRVRAVGLVRTEAGAVQGVEIAGGAGVLRAPVVVAADGGTSVLARRSVRAGRRNGRFGYAVRAYFDFKGAGGLDDLLRFVMPLADPATGARLPAYGWIFPMGPDRINIGVGVAERQPGVNLAEMFARFAAELRAGLPGFASARQVGPLRGAPLYTGFAPERSWAPGLLLAGDAAGMVNPATGEGISFALESGKIAAEIADARLAAGRTDDFSAYATRLARRFSGHLETGRHAAVRHRLAWRVLEDTFESDRPIFALVRRATLSPGLGLDPEAVAMTRDMRRCLHPGLGLGSQLVVAGEILADTVRRDWPFLARLHSMAADEHVFAPRPALFVLLAARCRDEDDGHGARSETPEAGTGSDHLIPLAASADLAAMALLAAASVDVHAAAGVHSGPNWGTTFAVLASDLLLARALALCATASPPLAAQVASAVEEACRGRVRELAAHRLSPPPAPRRWLELSSRSGLAALTAASCELGARAGGATEEVIAALGSYGRNIGLAVQLLEDDRRLSGGTDRLGRDALADLDEASPCPAFRLARAQLGARLEAVRPIDGDIRTRAGRAGELADLIGTTTALQQTRAWIRELVDEAEHLLERVPPGPAHSSLAAIARQVRRHTGNAGRPAAAGPAAATRVPARRAQP
ncbi:geranylgeranyl reductase family protein [Actinomadura sp. 6K520]|uniref:geranylgeranyl reductase family protein n=1 Tax=Actinomadura sp. 6K520 TaxID=2530364 RepID=UPI001404475C|nr:geranylgeranyl reductase family protein [Actinomadura sp. 6K520]